MWPTVEQIDAEKFWLGYQMLVAEAVCMGMLVAWSLRSFAAFVWGALKDLSEGMRRRK